MLLLAILLFPLSLFAQQADVTSATIDYAENGTDAVRDFDSDDPEGAGITWSIRGVDAADFTIDANGVLSFVSSPDFENPTDRARAALDLNGDDNMDGPGEAAVIGDNNMYQITVSATESWDENDQTLPAKRTDLDVTVAVSNENDPGEFSLKWLQPEVGTAIEAVLTDEDGDTDTVTSGVIGTTTDERGYTWYISKVPDPRVGVLTDWNEVGTQPDSSTYIPVEADANANAPRFLRAKVVYTDPQNGNSPRTLNAVSENPVRAQVAVNVSGSPDFGARKVDTRTAPEDVAVGANVGPAVTANDRSEDILTYELIAAPAPNQTDVNYFNIDRTNGQITVAQALDADAQRDSDGSGDVNDVTTQMPESTW